MKTLLSKISIFFNTWIFCGFFFKLVLNAFSMNVEKKYKKKTFCGRIYKWIMFYTFFILFWLKPFSTKIYNKKLSNKYILQKQLILATWNLILVWYVLPQYTNQHYQIDLKQQYTAHYIILNNGILKSSSSIFPRSEGYITL